MSSSDWFFWINMLFAVYRITYLIVREDGPFDVVVSVVAWADRHAPILAKAMSCFYCMSLWVSAGAVAFFYWFGRLDTQSTLLGWLSLSGLAIVLYDWSVNPADAPAEDGE